MTTDQIFELANSNKYVYAESFIKIENNIIQTVDYNCVTLGIYDDGDLTDEICNIEFDKKVNDGYYIIKALFQVHIDSDDYRQWTYLENLKFELTFQCTENEMNASPNDINDDFSFDFF